MNRTAVIVTLGLLLVGAVSTPHSLTGQVVAPSCGDYARAVDSFLHHRYDVASDVNSNGVLDSADLEQLFHYGLDQHCLVEDQCASVGATYRLGSHTLVCVRTPHDVLALRLISSE